MHQYETKHGSIMRLNMHQYETKHGIQYETKHGIQYETKHGIQYETKHGIQYETKHGIQYETKHRVFTCVVRLSISLITVFESPKVFATSSIFVRAFYKEYKNYNTNDDE